MKIVVVKIGDAWDVREILPDGRFLNLLTRQRVRRWAEAHAHRFRMADERERRLNKTPAKPVSRHYPVDGVKAKW